MVVLAPVRVSGEPWGTLRIEVPVSALEAAIRDATLRVLLIGAVLILLGAVAALWLARAVTRPVSRLGELAHEVARGNLDVEAPIDSEDEIGFLAGSFNAMVASLRASREQIRSHSEELRQSAERAQELATSAQEASRAKSQFLANMSHEIRTPHERRDRDDRAAPGDRAPAPAAPVRGDGPDLRRLPALAHQRHPGFLEDRGGKDRAGGDRLRPHAERRGRLRAARRARPTPSVSS
jgi:HAMP domain-containing protein